MPFQTSVASQQACGIEGDFAGHNPIFTRVTPDEGMFVAGALAPFVGRFGWIALATGVVTSQHPGLAAANVSIGFIGRDNPVYFNPTSDSSMQTLAGREIAVLEDATVWARFAAGATAGQKVYASYATGACRAAATGAPATATGTTASTTNGSPNLSAVAGTLVPGEPISGTGIPAGAYVVSVNTAAATAVISANATATGSAVALTRTTDFETAWTVRSACGNNELAKISVRG